MRFVFAMLCAAALGLGEASAQSRPAGPAVPPTPVKLAPVDAPPATGKVEIEVLVVHATNNGEVDPRLEGVAQNLKFTRYSGFSVLQTHEAKLAPGGDASFTIAGGRKLQVTLIDRDSRDARVRVLMYNQSGKVLDTTASIHRNRAFIIMGPDHEGGKLVLPVMVTY